ncbi:MAG: hypothetical protein WC916_02175 [Candidatus Woesearchaeota archaeon]
MLQSTTTPLINEYWCIRTDACSSATCDMLMYFLCMHQEVKRCVKIHHGLCVWTSFESQESYEEFFALLCGFGGIVLKPHRIIEKYL